MQNVLRALLALALVSGTAPLRAAYIEYRFTVTTALQHGSEFLGGPTDPTVFTFRVDSSGQDLSGSPLDGIYPIGDHGVGGNGAFSVGGVTAELQGGAFHVSNAPAQDVLAGTVNLQTNTALINGRTLFVASAAVWDTTAQMFTGTDLPLTADFAGHVTNGAFSLIFFARPGDSEYLTGDYVRFSAFVAPDDISIDVLVIDEPPPLALAALALAATGLVRGRKTVVRAVRS